MQSEFIRDLADKDGPIAAAAKERDGKPIRLRIQPMVLRAVKGRGAQYHAWKDVRWTVECDSPAEAYAVRDALLAFFPALSRAGAKTVIKLLKSAKAAEAAEEAAGEAEAEADEGAAAAGKEGAA
jgi:hypothetical protein